MKKSGITTKTHKKEGFGTFYDCPEPSVMRITGVEPARVLPPEPKSGASANSAISAYYTVVIMFLGMKKAGDGNRTHVSSLEG